MLTVNTTPAVTASPSSLAVNAGQAISFTAAATGTPKPTVQWQVMTNGGTSYANIAGATSTTYAFTATAAQSGNLYRAVFTNAAGPAATTPAALTINSAPVVATNPTNQAISAGLPVSFTAAATGTPMPTVQWQVLAKGSTSYTNIAGATSTTYTFTAAAAESGNLYRAVFTNALGQATTTSATLTINTVGTVVIPKAVYLVPPTSISVVQALTLTPPVVVRLAGSTTPAKTTSPSSSGLTVLQPAAVAIVLTERLG